MTEREEMYYDLGKLEERQRVGKILHESMGIFLEMRRTKDYTQAMIASSFIDLLDSLSKEIMHEKS